MATATPATLSANTDPKTAIGLLTSGAVTQEAYLSWDNARLQAVRAASAGGNGNGAPAIGCKVNKSGGLSVSGFGQWPLNMSCEGFFPPSRFG